ncbi:Non-heme chloroperoxidase [Actinokineospora spheciospongiae]|uniref:Non-heme chloroperoxidase n=1 Tax=Actinokineospora spheciospongiae TaxID=909613 RepID=W7IMY7_9PSEU|nr:alpha/beta hydrolase [Actinokineospora spheciospongiae]EWC62245.1 Non-heme chloroperoxidase [Actinokineospora spheciospongiae]
MTTETTVRTGDGVSLHVSATGSGPAVVLVAGYGATAASWVFQVDALTAAGYRAVCVDRRSHGRSDNPPFGHRVSRHGKDLREVLDALDLGPVALVGGSMGASAIWAMLDLFGTGSVRGVVSVDQTPKMINSADWENGFYGLTDDNSGTFFADGVPQTSRGLTPEQSLPAHTRLVERLGDPTALGVRPEGTEALLRDHAQQDWRDVVTRADLPVLMVAGAQSQYWPAAHAEAAVRDTADGRAVTIEDCGHAANLDRPAEFNTALLTFLHDL